MRTKPLFSKRITFLASLLVAICSTVWSQIHPDFGGKWFLTLDKSTLEAPWTDDIMKGFLQIKENSSSFHQSSSLTMIGKVVTEEWEVNTNGEKQKDDDGTIRQMVWDDKDSTVLITTTRGDAVTKLLYSIDPEGLLTIEETHIGADTSYSNHWVFHRKSAD